MNPLISVCIPTYNGAKYLKECLDSVIAQTFTDFEILIIDDRSSDETVSIARKYAANDQRICVIVNEQNLGLAGNWNRCVELAKGKWIKFVFQDDLIEPTCLERMLAANQPEIPIIFCRRQFIFETSTAESNRRYYLSTLSLLDKLFSRTTEMSASDYCRTIIDQLSANPKYYAGGINFIGEPVAVMLRKDVFYQFGNFNPYLIQFCDFEFWTRVAIHTGITYVPETLVTFRVHGESTSAINEGSRKYRKSLLDPLVMVHDFAFHPTYAPLRAVAHHHLSINLVDIFANRAYDARRMARYAATDSVNPDPSLLVEWEEISRLYPILLSLSKRSLFKQIIVHSLYRWRQFHRQIEAFLRPKASILKTK
jgi:glycosyltransferase involved in cell wall biosynthesis